MPIVTETGFAPLDARIFLTLEELSAQDPESTAPDAAAALPNDADPAALIPYFSRLALIRIPFPSFADGRGFSLAQRLRALGYQGRLRAAGHVISDQFRFALSCGFDEIEIDDALAARQPEAEWRAAGTQRSSYRDKLRRAA